MLDCSCCLCFIWAWELWVWANIPKLSKTGCRNISFALWIRTVWKPSCFFWSFLFFWKLWFWCNSRGGYCATDLRCCDDTFQAT